MTFTSHTQEVLLMALVLVDGAVLDGAEVSLMDDVGTMPVVSPNDTSVG